MDALHTLDFHQRLPDVLFLGRSQFVGCDRDESVFYRKCGWFEMKIMLKDGRCVSGDECVLAGRLGGGKRGECASGPRDENHCRNNPSGKVHRLKSTGVVRFR